MKPLVYGVIATGLIGHLHIVPVALTVKGEPAVAARDGLQNPLVTEATSGSNFAGQIIEMGESLA